MEKFKQKWVIASLLEDAVEGLEFDTTEWPLHVTLVGVFAIDIDGDALVGLVSGTLKEQKGFEIVANGESRFGPNKDIAVTIIEKKPELLKLHQTLIDDLVSNGAKFNDPQYQGEGYLPHCTVQKHIKMTPGEKAQVKSVSIIDMFPGGDGRRRKIYKTIDLPIK